MLAAFRDKLSATESLVAEHSRALEEIEALLQLDSVAAAAEGSVMAVHRRPDGSQTSYGSRLVAIRRLLSELQQRADHADIQVHYSLIDVDRSQSE